MLGLPSLRVCSSFFKRPKKKNKPENCKPIQKTEKRYSFEGLQIGDENFTPEDLKDDLLSCNWSIKRNWVWYHKYNEKTTTFTEEGIKSNSINKKVNDSVNDKISRDYEQSFFQDFERFLNPYE